LRVMVVGGGGREHAIAWKLARSARRPELYAAPGNPGMARLGRCVDVDPGDVKAVADAAEAHSIDLVIVGPEAPLAAGLVDLLESRGMRAFGPRRDAARLEASKAYARRFALRAGIPSPRFQVFDSAADARDFVARAGAPCAVKADGLAAGKGVFVAGSEREALEAVDALMVEKRFGDAGSRVVIEELLEGEEVSAFAVTDGESLLTLGFAQDHKRVFDGDRGPNTGGMGAYSPVPRLSAGERAEIVDSVLRRAVEGLREEGVEYRGFLYAGLMMTGNGPRLLEFNVRLGDPEAQVILPLLRADLLDLVEEALEGGLAGVEPRWVEGAAACVVLASGGYPGRYRVGVPVEGLDEAERLPGVLVFHAGTGRDEGRRDAPVVTAGGRVLGVTGTGPTLGDALDAAYRGAEAVRFEGKHYRRDIGARALEGAGGA